MARNGKGHEEHRAFVEQANRALGGHDVGRARAFATLADREFDFLALVQRSKTVGLDLRVMDE
jgi:hypothetical protein